MTGYAVRWTGQRRIVVGLSALVGVTQPDITEKFELGNRRGQFPFVGGRFFCWNGFFDISFAVESRLRFCRAFCRSWRSSHRLFFLGTDFFLELGVAFLLFIGSALE